MDSVMPFFELFRMQYGSLKLDSFNPDVFIERQFWILDIPNKSRRTTSWAFYVQDFLVNCFTLTVFIKFCVGKFNWFSTETLMELVDFVLMPFAIRTGVYLMPPLRRNLILQSQLFADFQWGTDLKNMLG